MERLIKLLGERRVQSLPLVFPYSLQRIYISLGVPISTLEYAGDWERLENQVDLRNRTREALIELIEETRRFQATDPKRYPLSRVSRAFRRRRRDE
jgi:hypothetical protein